jgi:hypothetical protein
VITRMNARLVAELLAFRFTESEYYHHKTRYHINEDRLYDFLYDYEFEGWLCNGAVKSCTPYREVEGLKRYVMRLHTGETLFESTKNWTWEQRQRLGQRCLTDLAASLLVEADAQKDAKSCPLSEFVTKVAFLRKSLELDGYFFMDGHLFAPEREVLDTKDRVGVLEALYSRLSLSQKDTAMHHLALSAEHYQEEKWDDSISNSRKFLECVLQAVALAYSQRAKPTANLEIDFSRPVRVREYLKQEGLLEKKEFTALTETYGLLSETGSHPYMAQNDQARLLRYMALVYSEFSMLRLEGALKSPERERVD